MKWEYAFVIISAVIGLPTTILLVLDSCRKLDEHMPQELTKKALKVLNRSADTESSLAFFLFRFDKLFCSPGTQFPMFWRCARFSCLVFSAVVCSWVILAAAFAPHDLKIFVDKIFYSSNDYFIPLSPIQNILIMVSFVLGINVIGDYFSLLETRYMLGKIHASKSLPIAAFLWCCDIVLSLILFCIFFIVGYFILYVSGAIWYAEPFNSSVYTHYVYMPVSMLQQRWIYTFGEPGDVIFSVCLYTTMSTTVWAGLATLEVKWHLLLRIVREFPLTKKSPFGAVTLAVIALIVSLVMVVMLISNFVRYFVV